MLTLISALPTVTAENAHTIHTANILSYSSHTVHTALAYLYPALSVYSTLYMYYRSDCLFCTTVYIILHFSFKTNKTLNCISQCQYYYSTITIKLQFALLPFAPIKGKSIDLHCPIILLLAILK